MADKSRLDQLIRHVQDFSARTALLEVRLMPLSFDQRPSRFGNPLSSKSRPRVKPARRQSTARSSFGATLPKRLLESQKAVRELRKEADQLVTRVVTLESELKEVRQQSEQSSVGLALSLGSLGHELETIQPGGMALSQGMLDAIENQVTSISTATTSLTSLIADTFGDGLRTVRTLLPAPCLSPGLPKRDSDIGFVTEYLTEIERRIAGLAGDVLPVISSEAQQIQAKILAVRGGIPESNATALTVELIHRTASLKARLNEAQTIYALSGSSLAAVELAARTAGPHAALFDELCQDQEALAKVRVDVDQLRSLHDSLATLPTIQAMQSWFVEQFSQLERTVSEMKQGQVRGPGPGDPGALESSLAGLGRSIAKLDAKWSPIYLGRNRLLLRSVREQPLICFASDLEVTATLATHGIWEPELSVLVHELLRPGMRVMDVGAHVGYYTVFMAGLVGASGEVHSFEPTKGSFQLLSENCLLNHCSHVCRLNNLALGDREGVSEISVFGHDSGSSTLSHLPAQLLNTWPSGATSEVISMSTLDDVFSKHGYPAFDFIKMDVEGAEALVLEGGRRFFERSILPSTVMALEYNPPAMEGLQIRPQRLIKRLRSSGFSISILEEMHQERPFREADFSAKSNLQLIARRDAK